VPKSNQAADSKFGVREFSGNPKGGNEDGGCRATLILTVLLNM
jgi:hypothetical protein